MTSQNPSIPFEDVARPSSCPPCSTFSFGHICPRAVTPSMVDPKDQAVESRLLPQAAKISFRQQLELMRDEHGGAHHHHHYDHPWRRPTVQVIGHRGAVFAELENTRESFLQCAEWGCDGVELDVFTLPSSNQVVVYHGTEPNGGLASYCTGFEQDSPITKITDLTWEQIQALKFNPYHSEFPCPKDRILTGRVPLLQHVLLDLKRYPSFRVKIELKGPPSSVLSVLHMVETLQMQSQCSYSSFHLDTLAELRRLRPDRDVYPSGALFDAQLPENYLDLAIHKAGTTEIHLRYDTCTVSRVKTIHDAGLRCMAWFRGPVGMTDDLMNRFTFDDGINNNNFDDDDDDGLFVKTRSMVDESACYDAIWDTGVDAICCNRPDLLVAMRLRNQQHQRVEAAWFEPTQVQPASFLIQ